MAATYAEPAAGRLVTMPAGAPGKTRVRLACLGVPFLGWWRTAGRLLLASAGFTISLAVAYKTMNHSAFHAINGSTTNRDVVLKAARSTLFLHVLEMGGAILALALVGLLTRNYDLVATMLFRNSFGKGHFYRFRLALNPGQGYFTSLKQLKTTDWGT